MCSSNAIGLTGLRTVKVALSIVVLTAISVAGIYLLGTEGLSAWKVSGNAERTLSSGAFDELLSFRAPVARLAQFETKVKESHKSKAENDKDVLLVKNWKYTLSVSDLVTFLVVYTPFPTYSAGSLAFIPPAFTPPPYTGPATSITGTSLYNLAMSSLLQIDRAGDYLQWAFALNLEKAKLTAVLTGNTFRFASYAFLMGYLANLAISAVIAIPFVGPFLAIGIAVATTVYIASQLQSLANLERTWAQNYLNTIALFNSLLNQHLAKDVFTPIVPATPFTF